IRMSVEVVGGGAARYRVAVQAGSIRRALQIARALRPGGGGGSGVGLPVDPEASLVGDPAAAAAGTGGGRRRRKPASLTPARVGKGRRSSRPGRALAKMVTGSSRPNPSLWRGEKHRR
ncbi:MAG TPA: hypothetical protein VKA51_02735, partial [Rubrobacteraceae bacterium]|nr:hypothetical protein [Rubrobacteraceae bacterium]